LIGAVKASINEAQDMRGLDREKRGKFRDLMQQRDAKIWEIRQGLLSPGSKSIEDRKKALEKGLDELDGIYTQMKNLKAPEQQKEQAGGSWSLTRGFLPLRRPS